MANEYLIKEYEFCFEQLRFYDTRQENLLKYLCSLTAAVGTAQFAVFQLLHGDTNTFYRCESLLSGLVFLATVLLFLAMLQNRLYFVFMARQLNAIRGHLMENASDGFDSNQLYTSTNFPALKPMSIHTFQLVGAALVSSLFAGASVYGLVAHFKCGLSITIAALSTLLSLTAEVGGGIAHLNAQGRKTADRAIHHTKKSH